MISTIYYFAIIGVVLINVAALTLITLRFIPLPATARATGILVVCLAMFSLEHFVGMGTLYHFGLPMTVVSLYVIWRERSRVRDATFKSSALVFLCAILYGLIWRLSSPEIIEDNDRLTDFHLVSNYLAGEQLPPLDHWLPHQRLSYYYTFQHYSAALLGRIFGLEPGTAFNLAAVILGTLVVALAWELLTLLRVRFILKLLSIAALVIGGTGLSPFFHIITSAPPDSLFAGTPVHAIFYNSRFVGWFENSVTSDVWRAIFGDATQRAALLPIETFGYQYPLGGYHAVLSGFLLLFLALTIFVAIPQAPKNIRGRLEFVLGLTVPLTLCSNAWTFPLQAALVASWKLWDGRTSGNWDLRALSGGAAVGVLLLLPFLAGLGAATHHMQLRLVPSFARTPPIQFLIVFWPLLALAATVPFAGPTKSLPGLLAAVFVSFLLLTEILVAADGGYKGEFVRFNSTLKWWGWIFSGGVFSLSAFLLASDRRGIRLFATIVLILVSTFAIDRALFFASRHFPGKLNGTGFYARDLPNAGLLRYLADAPHGIVLERLYTERPVDTGIYGSFARKPNLIGIPWVLRVWRRDLTELPGLITQINAFYAAAHPNAARFLTNHNIRYVVWSARENKELDTWQAITQAIDTEFRWMEFSDTPDSHIGIWIRR